jgi:hypothetical protein
MNLRAFFMAHPAVLNEKVMHLFLSLLYIKNEKFERNKKYDFKKFGETKSYVPGESETCRNSNTKLRIRRPISIADCVKSTYNQQCCGSMTFWGGSGSCYFRQ